MAFSIFNRVLLQTVRSSVICVLSRNAAFSSVPRAPAWYGLGTLPYILKAGGPQNFHLYIDSLHKQLGPLFIGKFGEDELLFISDADMNIEVYQNEGLYPEHYVPRSWTYYLEKTRQKRGLFFMDGPEWASSRTLLIKYLMNPTVIMSHVHTLSQVTDDLIGIWKSEPPEKELERHLYSWNVDCIGSIAFGRRLGILKKMSDSGDETKFVNSIISIFAESAKIEGIPPQFARILKFPAWRRFYKSVSTALDIGTHYVEEGIERAQSSPKSSQKEGECTDSHCPLDNKSTLVEYLLQKEVEPDLIKRLLIDLILAAADTTSQTATWLLYTLGTNPDIMRKAREEVALSVPRSSDTLGSDVLGKMSFVKAVIKEVLRLYPVAPFLTRKLASDVVLNGYGIPAGTMVITSLWSMGRSPIYFPDPANICPERWLRQKESSLDEKNLLKTMKSAYIPWGLGARSCIGRRIAETELLVLLIKLLQEFDWTVEEQVEPISRMILIPSKSVVLKLKSLKSEESEGE